MMFSHVLAKKFKTFHIIVTQLVKICIRLLKLFNHLKISFLKLECSFLYLLIFKLRESLLNLHIPLWNLHTILILIYLVRKRRNLSLQHFILSRKCVHLGLGNYVLFLLVQVFPRKIKGFTWHLEHKRLEEIKRKSSCKHITRVKSILA